MIELSKILDEFQRKLSEIQSTLAVSVSEEQAREYVRRERQRNVDRDKPYRVPRDGFINDYD